LLQLLPAAFVKVFGCDIAEEIGISKLSVHRLKQQIEQERQAEDAANAGATRSPVRPTATTRTPSARRRSDLHVWRHCDIRSARCDPRSNRIPGDLAHLLTAAFGPSRHFIATQSSVAFGWIVLQNSNCFWAEAAFEF
jgi:hypothetical protein